jgi:DNA-binding GntR family transcriptional regulator
MERTTFDAAGRAIEFGQHVYRASRYALVSAVTIGEANSDQRV